MQWHFDDSFWAHTYVSPSVAPLSIFGVRSNNARICLDASCTIQFSDRFAPFRVFSTYNRFRIIGCERSRLTDLVFDQQGVVGYALSIRSYLNLQPWRQREGNWELCRVAWSDSLFSKYEYYLQHDVLETKFGKVLSVEEFDGNNHLRHRTTIDHPSTERKESRLCKEHYLDRRTGQVSEASRQPYERIPKWRNCRE